jgi:hypothetical protein
MKRNQLKVKISKGVILHEKFMSSHEKSDKGHIH